MNDEKENNKKTDNDVQFFVRDGNIFHSGLLGYYRKK
jgi:hypothetical protein